MSGYPPYNTNPQYNPQGYPGPGYPGQPQPGMPGYPGQPQPQPQPGLYPQVPFVQPVHPGQPGYAPPSAPVAYPPSGSFNNFPGYGAQAVEWVPATYASVDALTHRAVVGGYEGYDGSPLWVIRGHFEGDIIPGKLAIKHKAAYVPWGGVENKLTNFEVCCAPADRVRWIESSNGTVPPTAIPGGRTSAGEPLYIGRAKEQGALTPGKIHPSHQTLYVSFGGNEVPHRVYEVLCSV